MSDMKHDVDALETGIAGAHLSQLYEEGVERAQSYLSKFR